MGLKPGASFCDECGQVVFTDEKLSNVVRQTLKKPLRPLTRGAIRELTTLDAPNRELQYLRGLDSAVTLTRLVLRGNQISDVSPLASLTNLTDLGLEDNPLNQKSIDVHVPNLKDRGVSVR